MYLEGLAQKFIRPRKINVMFVLGLKIGHPLNVI